MSQENEMLSIDIASLRLPDNFATAHGGAKLPTKASFGKLSKHRFCRTHPGQDYQFPAMIVDDKEGREVYLVHMKVAAHLGPMAKSVILRLCVDNAGTPKIIAQPILDSLRRSTLWTTTMAEAIELSETEWVRVESNMEAQQYTIIKAVSNLGDPQWPTQSMEEIVQEVFLGRIIATENHPFIRQLQGML